MRHLGALLVLAALAVSACEDADGESAPDPAGVLSIDAIEEALLPEGTSVDGGEVGPEDLPGLADDRKADPASCQPLTTLKEVDPEPERTRTVQVKRPSLGPWVYARLLSYAGDDAEQVLALVGGALEKCATGFAEDRFHDVRVEKVVEERAPDIGDEAVAYAVTTVEVDEQDSPEMVEHVVLVRDGQQVLSFRGNSFDDGPEATALLSAVVAAQWQRYDER